MKTVHSFFPTTTKSKASYRKQITYKVMKKVDSDPSLQIEQINTKSNFHEQKAHSITKVENIFRDKQNSVKNYSIDENNERPIGGVQLFKRMQKANHAGMEESLRRISKKGSRKNINLPRDKNNSNYSRSNHYVNIIEKEEHTPNAKETNVKEEMFKEHTDCKEKYTTYMTNQQNLTKSIVGNYVSQPQEIVKRMRKYSASETKQRSNTLRKFSHDVYKITKGLLPQTAKSSSMQSLSHVNEKEKSQLRWASDQEKNYLDKMAILNEINYNRPLIEKLGGKYFQCMLRNRYMDEPEYNHKSPYIYQIKEKMADTKFISKIKSMKCNFMERNKIVVKGRSKLNREQEGRMDQKDTREGKKRWEEWNQDDFDQ